MQAGMLAPKIGRMITPMSYRYKRAQGCREFVVRPQAEVGKSNLSDSHHPSILAFKKEREELAY